jgi:hypothetical protein
MIQGYKKNNILTGLYLMYWYNEGLFLKHCSVSNQKQQIFYLKKIFIFKFIWNVLVADNRRRHGGFSSWQNKYKLVTFSLTFNFYLKFSLLKRIIFIFNWYMQMCYQVYRRTLYPWLICTCTCSKDRRRECLVKGKRRLYHNSTYFLHTSSVKS